MRIIYFVLNEADELVLLMRGPDPQVRLREAINHLGASLAAETAEPAPTPSVSIGFTRIRPQSQQHYDIAYQQADEAQYRSKAYRANRITEFDAQTMTTQPIKPVMIAA